MTTERMSLRSLLKRKGEKVFSYLTSFIFIIIEKENLNFCKLTFHAHQNQDCFQ